MSVDPHTALPAHLAALLEDVCTNQQRLRYSMFEGMAAAKGAGVNDNHVRLSQALTKATVDLSRELRAWAKATKEASKNLSVSERIALVVSFINGLSVADRREFDRLMGGGDD